MLYDELKRACPIYNRLDPEMKKAASEIAAKYPYCTEHVDRGRQTRRLLPGRGGKIIQERELFRLSGRQCMRDADKRASKNQGWNVGYSAGEPFI